MLLRSTPATITILATDSIHGAAEEDRPLFSGLSLQFREERHRQWTLYHPYGSSRGKSPRAFALHILALLPATSRKRREELAATVAAMVQGARSEIRYDDLSERAKELWDGRATMTPIGILTAAGLSFRTSNGRQEQALKAFIIQLIGYDGEGRGCVPCRLHSIVGDSLKLQVLSFRGEWVDVPFQVLADVAELKAAAKELSVAWKSNRTAGKVPRPDAKSVQCLTDLRYTRFSRKTPAKQEASVEAPVAPTSLQHPAQEVAKRAADKSPQRRPGDGRGRGCMACQVSKVDAESCRLQVVSNFFAHCSIKPSMRTRAFLQRKTVGSPTIS